jgi:hypothetical protein
MKSINYALLVALSSLTMTACGGGSGSSGPSTEASADEVAALVTVQEDTPISREDARIAEVVENNNHETDFYEKVDWIPNNSVSTSSKKLTYKPTYSSNRTISSKVESDGTDTTIWSIYSGGKDNAIITTIYDDDRKSDVIEFRGDGIKSGYKMGYSYGTNSGWNDSVNKTIKWSMKFNEQYVIYVRVSTKDGYRYLYYTAKNKNYGKSAKYYIHNGLGSASDEGSWLTVTRNLNADLKRFEPMNEVTSVDGFFVRGSGLIDDVELLKTEATIVNETLYEDAEDGEITGWRVYDKNPSGAEVLNVTDADSGSKVIELKGDGTKNGYLLGTWNNTINKEISWDMKYDEDYVIYLSVETKKGHRFITYSPMSEITCTKKGEGYGQGKKEIGGYTYIHTYLCPNTKDGTWKTISRNIELDLKKYESDNELISVDAFLIRGSGRVDNIKMFDTNADGDYDNSTN